jgi:hypothetical protein
MKRLLLRVTVALLCVAGAELTLAPVISSDTGQSVTVRHITATPHGYPPTTAPVPSAADQTAAAAKVKQAMQAVLPAAQVGFEVFDRQDNTVLTSHDAGRQFASMSLVKLLIALDALASDNWATPDDATQQKLHQMLADSNDDIADNLWTTHGGPAIVTRMASLLGLTGTQPPKDPGMWGDTLITPHDMVTVYRYIIDQLPRPSRDFLLSALAAAPRIAADGFDQYFGIPDGMPNTTWAIKQGWGTSGSQAVMNSTGLVGTDLRYAVVVLVSVSANSYSKVPAVVTAGAGALANLVGATVS